ncbi:MAG TPA: hypothetical protein VF631_12175 [Allosphingosinicella sp.]|uniref:hypothetical protein n=1 Tax=Allosphingosinicella sp. TaxID=2823234 RepID=UPI002F2AAAA9
MRRFASLTATAAIVTSGLGLEQPASALEPGLAVGTCIVTGYGSKGVIIGTTQNGYRIRLDLTGGILPDQYHGGVTAAPCPATAAGANAPPTPQGRGSTGKATVQRTTAGGCFASEPEKAGLEGTLRGVIRRAFEKDPPAGLDGAVTVRFQSFRVSPGRKADIIDRVQYKPDLRKPVYSVRAQFETCTDFRTATTTRQMERNFLCFTNSTSGQNCSVTGTTAGMRKDTEQYVPK